MPAKKRHKRTAYTRYPYYDLFLYNGLTILHYLLGGFGIIYGYNFSMGGYVLGSAYLVFAFFQMYLLMPLTVCPNCVYYRLMGSLCISGLNVISRKITKAGKIQEFHTRSEGLLCHNNLYLAAKAFPILAMLPALIINFSLPLLTVFLTVVGLLLFRIFIIFPKIACVHCRAKNICPNAIAMGISGGS